MVTFYFVKSHTLIGKLIRITSGGKYNHVSIWVRGYLYEASMKYGVTKVRCDRDYRSSNWLHVWDLNEDKVVEFLDAQVGKRYDWLGVISFIWIFVQQGVEKWFCSELAMVALMKGLGKEEYNQRQSPIDFYYLLKILQ
jgi:hypothetical protein